MLSYLTGLLYIPITLHRKKNSQNMDQKSKLEPNFEDLGVLCSLRCYFSIMIQVIRVLYNIRPWGIGAKSEVWCIRGLLKTAIDMFQLCPGIKIK